MAVMHLLGMLVALSTTASAVTPFQQPAVPSFCQRLAPQLGMKPNAKSGGKTRAGGWKVNLASGLGPALFGGTFAASFSLHPIDEDSVSESKRLENACGITAKGMTCKIEGPARLNVGTKKGKISTEVLPGERAEVDMRSTVISCYDT
ncbi:hypothetical protein U1763_06875 [Sphingomonas sp. LB2R24]